MIVGIGQLPWYCDMPAWVSDRFESCIPTQDQQAAIMASNFGASIDPTMKSQAISDFQDWMTSIDYTKTRQRLIDEDRAAANPFKDLDLSAYYPLLIGIGVFAVVAMSGGGPRRYGR
jgi:hypothetical protein